MDLLVLLLHHVEIDIHELSMAPELNHSSNKNSLWCIKQSKKLVGPDVCDHVHFIPAILGCDTTSRLFGLRKSLSVKKIKSDALFCRQAKVFIQVGQVVKQDIMTTCIFI